MRRLLIGLMVLLVIWGCDRYEHEPYESAALEAGFTEFLGDLSSTGSDDLESVLMWYSDDYMYNGIEKLDIENEYTSYFEIYGSELTLSGKLEGYWEGNEIKWELWANLADTSFVLAEKTDYFVEIDGSYYFRGNQVSPPELDTGKPLVLAQYFTAESCGNCPEAAEKLEEMHNKYGDQLVVVEYVFDHDPGNVYYNEAVYYGAGSQPTTIFQGKYIVVGPEEDKLEEYEVRYGQAVEEELQFKFTGMDLTVTGSAVTVHIEWSELSDIMGENLLIRSVLLEEHPDINYHSAPSVYFDNRILTAEDIEYDGSLNSAELTLESTEELPEDISVVVWLQDKVSDLGSDGVKIYNVIKREWEE